MNRRSFLKTAAGSAALFAISPSISTVAAEPGRAGDLLAEAGRRIEKHRKSDGLIVVRGADGRPVAKAKVRVEQVRHDFLFGCNFFRFGRLPEAKLEEEYRGRFADLLNYATLGFYWASYERERGRPRYEDTDQAVAWCREHGITCKGHPLVWDHPAGNPRWLPEDLAEIGLLSHARVRAIVARFKGRIDIWDVVNEATHLGHANQAMKMSRWAATLGAPAYVAEHLKIARAANPQATLLVNDYRLDPPYYRLLDSLRADGKLLFDVVGIQSHMHGGGWPLPKVWDHCETYAKLGLPLHFTETTVVSGPRTGRGESWGATTPELEARQADYVPKFYTLLFSHPAVEAITWWDFSDNGAWQGAAAGFLRRDMSPKPVYQRLMELIKKEWWTRTEGATDERGEFPTRAFCGTHRLTAELPGGRTVSREIHWQPRKENRFELAAAS